MSEELRAILETIGSLGETGSKLFLWWLLKGFFLDLVGWTLGFVVVFKVSGLVRTALEQEY